MMRLLIPTILLLVRVGLGFFYIISGSTKLVFLDTFSSVLTRHGVLPASLVNLAWAVPALEIALGCCILLFGASPRFPAARRVTAAAAALAPLAFTAYILMVPAKILETVGCGCGFLAETLFMPAHIALNVALAILGAALWKSPAK
jgi:uncharacterized membrane protein YphA (DoxX/SURF4 family)